MVVQHAQTSHILNALFFFAVRKTNLRESTWYFFFWSYIRFVLVLALSKTSSKYIKIVYGRFFFSKKIFFFVLRKTHTDIHCFNNAKIYILKLFFSNMRIHLADKEDSGAKSCVGEKRCLYIEKNAWTRHKLP